jgi:hypothetical protein
MLFGDREEGPPSGRHRLTTAAIETVLPAAAVVIGGDSDLLEDVSLALKFGVRLSAIGPTLAGELGQSDLPGEYDDAARILAAIHWFVGESREDAPEPERRVPYPYVMQQLVAEWEDEWGGPGEEEDEDEEERYERG